eukprot:gene3022-13045_t
MGSASSSAANVSGGAAASDPSKVNMGSASSSAANVSGGAAASDPTKVFDRLSGKAAKLDIQNIDTDMIIPKQFLKTINKSGLGKAAFYGLRYFDDGAERPEFILNQEGYSKSGLGKAAFFGLRYFHDGAERPEFILNQEGYRWVWYLRVTLFLKTISKSGLGKAAFFGLRYFHDGAERPEFILNQEGYSHVVLKIISSRGDGKAAFFGLRYFDDGAERPEFILNQEGYRNSSILVAADNFGCGSSREHAPWAMKDFGIRCIISTSFADIFYNNCFKNGMLPIVLPRADVDTLMADADAGKSLDVDLASQSITRPDGSKISFDINDFRKHCLINGLDDIGLTMQKADKIASFEAKRSVQSPWLDNATQKVVAVPV